MYLAIKPLSVNKVWKGRRFKTDDYKAYEKEVILRLKDYNVPNGDLELSLVFGFSSRSSDFDNPVKPFVDCLQKRYLFNDKNIKKCTICVEMVKKGDEFIEFEISKLKEIRG